MDVTRCTCWNVARDGHQPDCRIVECRTAADMEFVAVRDVQGKYRPHLVKRRAARRV